MEKSLIIGSDHGGYALKEILKQELLDRSYDVNDAGCYDTQSVHYPVIGKKVAAEVSSGQYPTGILICGTGIGMSIMANRFENVRAALCHDHFTAKMSRMHNNSNILVLGGRVTGDEVAKDILDVWLNTEFEGGRHQERIEMFDRQG